MNSFILLFSLIVMITVGAPIAIAMGASIVLVFIVGDDYSFSILPQIMISTASKWSLLAVPFFIMAGGLMNELGITDRLFRFARACVGHIKGGLCHVNVLASMIFAGISGAAIADIAGLGKIELKAMTDAGFSKKISAGITVASSIIGPIIPPSIAFILYGVIAQVSIIRLFIAGIFPGILIGISLMITTHFKALRNPDEFPRGEKPSLEEFIQSFKGAILAIGAPIMILTGMFTGLVSPTEAGAAATLYTIFAGIFFRTINKKIMWNSLKESMLQAAHALLLVSLASVMGYILTFEQTPQLIASRLGLFATNQLAMLLFIDIIFLIIGCFMSATASLILLTPILLPIVLNAGIDPIHFGVITAYALHIGIATPPVGMGLYVISDIANIKFEEAVEAVIPYLLPLIISLLIITYFPSISLWLPNMLFN